MPSPNPDTIFRAFSLMDCGSNAVTQLSEKKIMELRAKVPSSFIEGRWSAMTSMKTEPWIHREEKPTEKKYWKNDAANKTWSNLSSFERAQHIEKISLLFNAEAGTISDLEAMLHNISAKKFTNDVLPFLANYVHYYAGWAGLNCVNSKQLKPKGCVIVDVRQSAFPLLQAVLALAPALASGNTVNILATQRAESVLHLAASSVNIGLPAGVLNVIINDTLQMVDIVKEPSVIFAPFQSAKNLGAETFIQHANSLFSLHGRCYMLVLRHADCEAAVEALINEAANKSALSKWPLTEVLVEEHLYANFIQHLKQRMQNIDASTLPPSQWSEKDLNAIKLHGAEEQLQVLVKESAVILIGGRSPEASNTWEVESPSCKIPVSVLPVRSHSEAIGIIASRPRAEAASVWTEDGNLALQVASALKVSLVWINQHGSLPNPASTFGSWNPAGGAQFGGKEGLYGFLECVGSEQPEIIRSVKWDAVSRGESVALMQLALYYGGESRDGTQGNYKLCSLKGEPVAITSVASQKDVDAAVSSAYKAAAGWASKSITDRAKVLSTFADALLKQEATYEKLVTSLFNANLTSAKSDLQDAKNALLKWIYLSDKITGNVVGDGRPFNSCIVTNQPLGVIAICGSVGSFTSLFDIFNLIAPALLLGNTVVLSAAKNNPVPALMLAQTMLLHASLPAGVLNVVSWGVEGALSAHSDVAALWKPEMSNTALTSTSFKRVWQVPANFVPADCPVEWIVYQATKAKTICW